MNGKTELKSIQELLGMKFFIPSYQRGYRWTDLQIENLLNDINEFNKGIDGDFYCLQPLVVKERVKERNKDLLAEIKQSDSIEKVENLLKREWIVIDGQQRLTTVYLVLKALGNEMYPSLEYERKSYIKDCDESDEVKKDTIEIYYLTNAKKCIQEWIEKKRNTSEDFSVMFRNKILEQTKFIFYNVGEVSEDQEHDIFNNLNSGKIALTNAELIKALFLNKVGKEDIVHREVEQRLLADEFDQIEHTLRQDDFWYFLAGNTPKSSSCINLLFDLMLDADDQNDAYRTDESFGTFFYFNDLINGNGNKDSYRKSKEVWEQVRTVFHIMEGWFNDSVMYNLIGYHRAVKGGKALCDIYKKFCGQKSKGKFKKWLVSECKGFIDYPDGFMQLRYDDNKDKVFNLLLLFNIATLNERPQEAVKFSFANLYKYDWDVEHISPQNPKDDTKLKSAIEKFENEVLFERLQKAINDNNRKDIEDERRKYFASDEELMDIQNLTLLSAHDNRGIGNRFFFEKRQMLQEYYQQGSFIPACSMNVFMKFYSDKPGQMAFWDETDRKSYKDKIEKMIKEFFRK